MEALCYSELTLEEKLYLSAMAQHPGFTVFKKLIDDAFKQKMASIVDLSPEDPEYDTKLRSRQTDLRLTKEICAILIKSINMHAQAALVEQNVNKAREEEKLNEADPEFQARFGSIKEKPRKGEQSNT